MIVEVYQDEQGREPLTDWLNSIKDGRTCARIDARLDRLHDGNFGDWKSLKGGLYELRLDFGGGFRVYYTKEGDSRTILLTGGIKRSQDRDEKTARRYLADYKGSKQ